MIDVILITDKEIKKMNERWFGLKNATDVIAFDHGEIYISVDTARRQARARKVSLDKEILRLTVHGTVHIEGYEDCDLKNFSRMREQEWKVLIGAL